MQLYKLSEEMQAALSNMKVMLERDEIDRDSYEDTLEALTGELTDKVVNVGLHIKNLKSDASAIKAAIDEFSKRLKGVQSDIDFYEAYLFKHMKANHIEKAGNEFIDLKIKKMPDLVQINSSASVPSDYLLPAKPIQRSPDRKAILAALKNGDEVAGTELITGRQSLSIK